VAIIRILGSTAEAAQEELVQQFKGYGNPFSLMLIESKNLIFRGAPGTGKSYLAKEIATDIISNGYYENYTQLSDEQKQLQSSSCRNSGNFLLK
jgi:DNA replication protein DnaC